MALNERLVNLSESASVALADRVRRLRTEGKTIWALATGDPDFPTPAPIINAASEAMLAGATHYSFSRGLPKLREAIAAKHRGQGAEFDPETEILVTCGGVHAYHCALMAILNPDDEVLVPDPAWMTHVNTVKAVGGRPVRVPSVAENNFWPTLADWESCLTSRTVALVVNSPNNPTGKVAEADYLAEVVAFAVAHDLYVISDEVYDGILFDRRKHTCVASLPGAKDRTLLVQSLSKTYAMTGWRVGWLAGPDKVIAQALKAGQNSITNLAPFIQEAAAFALTDADMAKESRTMAEAYERRRDRVVSRYDEAQGGAIRLSAPEGAFYFFLDARGLGLPSQVVAERLLNEASVSVVPGNVYGPSAEGFLRMTIAASDETIDAGFEALMDWARKVRD